MENPTSQAVTSTTLAEELCNYIRQRTGDQNLAVEALNEAMSNCRTGKPWTGTAGHAGGGGAA